MYIAEWKKNIPLYQGNMVMVDHRDSVSRQGRLYPGKLTGRICVNEEQIALDDVTDIRYIGTITDYHTSGNTATIDEVFGFSVEEGSRLYEKLLYKEFTCQVSCHLCLNETGDRIVAEDVELVSYVHVLHPAILQGKKYLYQVQNGWKSGILQMEEETGESQIVLMDGAVVTPEEIMDVTRLPKVNDTVRVSLCTGEGYKGIVSVVNEEEIYLIYQEMGEICGKRILLQELVDLRFYGVVTDDYVAGNPSRSKNIDRIHAYKIQYFAENSGNVSDMVLKNKKVSYRVGLNGSGLIAKEIELEEMKVDWKYGLVIAYAENYTFGANRGAYFIGNEYYQIRSQHVQGNVLAERASVEGAEKIGNKGRDGRRAVSLVRYVLAEGKNRVINRKNLQLAANTEFQRLIEMERDVYGVRVRKDGEIEKITIVQKITEEDVWKQYKDKDAMILYRAGEEQKKIYGKLTTVENVVSEAGISETMLCCKSDTDTELIRIPVKDLVEIHLYGTVTAYDSTNGTGYIGDVFFHANDMLGEQKASGIGQSVMYELGLASKGNGFCGYNVMSTTRQEVVSIIDYRDQRYTVVAEREKEEIRILEYEGMEKAEEYINPDYAYQAVVTMEDRMGQETVLSIVLSGNRSANQYRKGQIQFFKNSNNYGFVVPWEHRDKDPEERRKEKTDIWFAGEVLVDGMLSGREINTRDFVYDILYREDQRKGKVDRIIVVDETSSKQANTFSGTNIPVSYRENLIAPVAGESIAYCGENDRWTVDVWEEGNTIRSEQESTWRFGVLTGYDMEQGMGYLNNKVRFSLSSIDEKLYNIVKTEPKKLLVMYEYREGKLGQITQIPPEVLNQLFWEEGQVVTCGTAGIERYVDVSLTSEQKIVRHYLSVSSDQKVNKLTRTPKTFQGTEVYVRNLYVPDWTKGEHAIPEAVVAEVRCKYEDLTIGFDENESRYKAYRHKKKSFPVEGAEELLAVAAKNEEEAVRVTFRLNEKNELQAVLEEYQREGSQEKQEKQKKQEDRESRLLDRLQEIMDDVDRVYYDEYTFILYTLLRGDDPDMTHLYRLFLPVFCQEKSRCFRETRVNGFDVEESFRALSAEGGNVLQFLQCMVILDNVSFDRMMQRKQEWLSDGLAGKLAEIQGHFAAIKTMYHPELQRNDWAAEFITNLRRYYKNKRETMLSWLDEFDGTVAELRSFLEGEGSSEEMSLFGDPAFLWLCGEGDKERLRKFQDILEKLDREKHTEEEWKILRDSLEKWIKGAEENPTMLVTEGLLENSIPEKILTDVENRLKTIFLEKEIPNLTVGILEEGKITSEQKYLTFYLQNVQEKGNKPLRDAENVKITLQIRRVDTEGQKEVLTTEKFEWNIVPQTREDKANLLIRRIDIPKAMTMAGRYEVQINGSYEYQDSYDGSKKPVEIESGTPEIETVSEEKPDYLKNRNTIGDNKPYKTEEVLNSDHPMFYGRIDELKKLQEALFSETGEGCVINLAPVIYVHGQKRCGKSSLVSQICSGRKMLLKKTLPDPEKKDAIKENLEFSETMVVQINGLGLKNANYLHELCENILWELAGIAEKRAKEMNPETELCQKLLAFHETYNEDEYELEDDYDKPFKEAIGKLKAIGYRVVLILDEFTAYCTYLLQTGQVIKGTLGTLNFIMQFQKMEIIQIIIGHERMMEVLDEMGLLNSTVKKEKELPVSAALSPEAGRDLIVSPIKDRLGYSPYDTPCGEQLIQYLFTLSGKYPYFLKILCNQICKYLSKNPIRFLSVMDMESILEESILSKEEKMIRQNQNSFESLFGENDDPVELKEKIKQCLACIAREKDGVIRKENLLAEQDEEIYLRLKNREVIEEYEDEMSGETYVRIPVGVFARYLRLIKER